MQGKGLIVIEALLIAGAYGPVAAVPGDASPRAMALGQAYTALARGPEAVFWNPANLALADSRKFSWDLLGAGLCLIAENNSLSVAAYNAHFTDANNSVSPNGSPYYISPVRKKKLLADIPDAGLRMNGDIEPTVVAGLPLNGGVAFAIGEVRSAIAVGFTSGVESEIPKDVLELFFFGNEFAEDRLAAGKSEGYDISDWNGSGWAVGTLNVAAAKPALPARLAPYLSEFTVGSTLKLSMGSYGEIIESGGTGLVDRVGGAEADAWLIAQHAKMGLGVGLDVGIAGRSKNRKTTFSFSVLNLLDTFSWSRGARQDSIFLAANELRISRFLDADSRSIEEVFDNPDFDGDGDPDFTKQIGQKPFSRSLPAMLRFGVAYQAMPRLTVVGNWDQAFSSKFGMRTRPRLASGVEYWLADWLPARIGLSLGGRSSSSAIGFAFGPFVLSSMQIHFLETSLAMRGGLFPGLAKGTAISVMFFRLSLV